MLRGLCANDRSLQGSAAAGCEMVARYNNRATRELGSLVKIDKVDTSKMKLKIDKVDTSKMKLLTSFFKPRP